MIHHIKNSLFDFVTSPSTWTSGNTWEWVFTIKISVFWTVYISPFIFIHHNTFINFTSFKSTILVKITHFSNSEEVFLLSGIKSVDITIISYIISRHEFSGDVHDIFTSPFTWACWTDYWYFTHERSITFITVIKSPSVFRVDNTLENFTFINGSILIIITFGHEKI